MPNKYIIVNATALDKSGALSILKQFISNIPISQHNWLVFTPPNISFASNKQNVRLEPITGVKPMYKRLWWDAFGLKRWLKNHHIEPKAAVSLQNTGFRVGRKVSSFIYYHQPIPFFPFKWNPLKQEHRTLWFYKYIYPFFVKLFLRKDTRIFVQLDFIKKGFSNKFNHSGDLIEVFSPSVIAPSVCETKNFLSEKISFFYPATNFFYKNHRIIFDALRHSEISADVYFTITPSEEEPQDNRIHYLGSIPYEKVCKMYNMCDALLFPSYIETYGLPLLEAAMTGMPIIVADLPYSREVLKGYSGAIYVNHNDPIAWALAMKDISKGKRFAPIEISNRKGWTDLFNSIISNIN